jgi:hypothetical protein
MQRMDIGFHRKGKRRKLSLSKNKLDRRLVPEAKERTVSVDDLNQGRVIPTTNCGNGFRIAHAYRTGKGLQVW